jgi:acyl carrier protein
MILADGEVPSVVAVHTAILAAIEARLGRPLRADEAELGFSALGLDSITLLELGAKLEAHFHVSLADFAAYEHPTPTALATHVAAMLGSGAKAAPANEPGSSASHPERRTRSSPPTGELISRDSSSAVYSFDLPSWPRREAG